MIPGAIGKLMFLDKQEWQSDMFNRKVLCHGDSIVDKDTGVLVLEMRDSETIAEVWQDYCDAINQVLPELDEA